MVLVIMVLEFCQVVLGAPLDKIQAPLAKIIAP